MSFRERPIPSTEHPGGGGAGVWAELLSHLPLLSCLLRNCKANWLTLCSPDPVGCHSICFTIPCKFATIPGWEIQIFLQSLNPRGKDKGVPLPGSHPFEFKILFSDSSPSSIYSSCCQICTFSLR